MNGNRCEPKTGGNDSQLAVERYIRFVEEVAKNQRLWIAESEEFTLVANDEWGRLLLPVWPCSESVQESLSDERKAQGFGPVACELAVWKTKSTPALLEDGTLIGVFPDREMASLVIDLNELNCDIDRAMTRLARSIVLQGSDLARLRRKLVKRKR